VIKIKVEITIDGSRAIDDIVIKQFNNPPAKEEFIDDVCYDITNWIERQLNVDSICYIPEVIARCEEW